MKPMVKIATPNWPTASVPLIVPGIDLEGLRLVWRGGDLVARFWLHDQFMPLFDAQEFGACTILHHAMCYLEDRLAYELYPHPRGKIRMSDYTPYQVEEKKNG